MRFALALVAMLSTLAPYASAQEIRDIAEGDVAVFQGDAVSIGQEHGRFFKSEIEASMVAIVEEHLPYWYHQWYASYASRRMAPHISDDMFDEIEGISVGADVDYSSVFYGNVLPDLNALSATPFACSSFAVLPDRSATGGMLVGRNLDWYVDLEAPMRETLRPFVLAREGAHRILAIGYPGMAGVLTGINEKGVFLSLNYSDSRDQTSAGLPVTLLVRKVLEEANTAEEARWIIESTKPRTIAINVLVADATNAFVAEITANREVFRQPTRGLVYAANHFESPLLGGPAGRDSRWAGLSRWDNTTTDLTFDDLRTTIADAGLHNRSWRNVKAVFVDYSAGTILFGSKGERAAAGDLGRINWKRLFSAQ